MGKGRFIICMKNLTSLMKRITKIVILGNV